MKSEVKNMEILTRSMIVMGKTDEGNITSMGVSIPAGHRFYKEEKIREFVDNDIIIITDTKTKLSEITKKFQKVLDEL